MVGGTRPVTSAFAQMAASTAHIPVLARFVLLISTGAWIWLISNWLNHLDTYPAKRGMYRALELWAISDVAVILAFM